jgi:hypothetical protein
MKQRTPEEVAMSDLQMESYGRDVTAFIAKTEKKVDVTKEHYAYPLLNALVAQVKDDFIESTLLEGPAEALNSMQTLIFQAFLALYELGLEGYELDRNVCVADHSE